MILVRLSLSSANAKDFVPRFHQPRREIRSDMTGTADYGNAHGEQAAANFAMLLFEYSIRFRALVQPSGELRRALAKCVSEFSARTVWR